MRLSQVFAETKPITIDMGDDALHVVYRPQAMTPELLERIGGLSGLSVDGDVSMEQIGRFAQLGNIVVAMLQQLVVEWDLIGDDGKPYPLTTEALRALPFAFLMTVVQALNKDVRPNPTKRASSAATSSMTG